MTDPETSEIDVRGTAVRVTRRGRGEPLVVLRGTDASDGWIPFLDLVAQRHEVIVPEHPGFGGRAMPPWLDRVADLANFHLDLIDRLDLGGVHLVGCSLGGWIATEMAMRTQVLASLTLVGAAGLQVAGAPMLDLFLLSEEKAIRARFSDQAKADAAIARMLRPENEDVRLSNAVAVARVAWQPRLYDPHLGKWLHRICAPTLAVWGEDDRVFPPTHADRFAASIAGAKTLIVPECGHWVHHERPDTLAAAVIEHARAHPRNAARRVG